MNGLPELSRMLRIYESRDPSIAGLVRMRQLGEVSARGRVFPIHGWVIGTEDRRKPTLGLFGGVHGLERVGTHVTLSYLEYLLGQLSWDRALRELMRKELRLVSIPIVNPGGMRFRSRSNPRGVDLMRNAPVESSKSLPLVGGHRIGAWLPWYRGKAGASLELEAQVLCDFVRDEMFESVAGISLDLHSGFGMRDRLWYPYARAKEAFPDEARVQKLRAMLDVTHTHHVYQVERQSDVYTVNGDLWDFLHDRHAEQSDGQKVFIPWTLEMGSWQWVRKNPSQVFRPFGLYDPILPHRYKRVMRRHLPMVDFFLKAALNWEAWK